MHPNAPADVVALQNLAATLPPEAAALIEAAITEIKSAREASLASAVAELNRYHRLHDVLSDSIESGRLTESDIPDDYQALVELLTKCSAPSVGDEPQPMAFLYPDGYLLSAVGQGDISIPALMEHTMPLYSAQQLLLLIRRTQASS